MIWFTVELSDSPGSLAKMAAARGQAIGIYAARVLDIDLPWTKMRQVYRLLGLVRRYGPGPVDTACARALELDVVNVTKIASMLEKATENTPVPPRICVVWSLKTSQFKPTRGDQSGVAFGSAPVL